MNAIRRQLNSPLALAVFLRDTSDLDHEISSKAKELIDLIKSSEKMK